MGLVGAGRVQSADPAAEEQQHTSAPDSGSAPAKGGRGLQEEASAHSGTKALLAAEFASMGALSRSAAALTPTPGSITAPAAAIPAAGGGAAQGRSTLAPGSMSKLLVGGALATPSALAVRAGV